jgi:hypothetical protein
MNVPEEAGPNTDDLVILDENLSHVALVKIQIWLRFQQPFHPELVGLLVALRTGGLNAWTLGGVQHAELNARGVRVQSHQSTQGIDLADKMPLGQPADRRVAGHLSDRVQILGQHGRLRSKPGGSHPGLDTRMSSAADEDVVGFGIGVEGLRHGGAIVAQDLLPAFDLARIGGR